MSNTRCSCSTHKFNVYYLFFKPSWWVLIIIIFTTFDTVKSHPAFHTTHCSDKLIFRFPIFTTPHCSNKIDINNNDWICSCKFNCHTITAKMAPLLYSIQKCLSHVILSAYYVCAFWHIISAFLFLRLRILAYHFRFFIFTFALFGISFPLLYFYVCAFWHIISAFLFLRLRFFLYIICAYLF